MSDETPPTEGAREVGASEARVNWLELARRAYQGSTDFLDSNYRAQWEHNLHLFRSEHPPGSKYLSAAYKHRSRKFRPKTRSIVRRNEAAIASAFFSSPDVITVKPNNDNDEIQKAGAELIYELLQMRLTTKGSAGIPWFKVLVGAAQDAQVNNVVISCQEWQYEERAVPIRRPEPRLREDGTQEIDEDGNELFDLVDDEEREVVKDRPWVRLVPIENFRFDPGADWLDPVNTSPYIVEIIPMYVIDIEERMQAVDPKTQQPQWRVLTRDQIASTINKHQTEQTRTARYGDSNTGQDNTTTTVTEFSIVWVHRNIVRRDGQDWLYYTLGTQYMLSEPVPLGDAYLHGIRPYAIGSATIEAHKPLPDSLVHLGKDLQASANQIWNTRFDNIEQVLNKRWKVARDRGVDLNSLTRLVPGGAVMMDDTEAVDMIDTPDVTGSAYLEQDRINVDMDELMGTFSQSSVQSNRNLNETATGMSLVKGDSDVLTEYLVRTFVETWAEEVLRQLMLLEQAYETDAVIMEVAAKQAQIAQKYGIEEINEDLMRADATIRVNVGLGATDPNVRLQKFVVSMETALRIMPNLANNLKPAEVINEVFGVAGYKDGARFFDGLEGASPQMQQAQAQMQELMQYVQQLEYERDTKAVETQGRATVEQIKQQGEIQREQLKEQVQQNLESHKHSNEMQKLQEEFHNRLDEMLYQVKLELGKQIEEAVNPQLRKFAQEMSATKIRPDAKKAANE